MTSEHDLLSTSLNQLESHLVANPVTLAFVLETSADRSHAARAGLHRSRAADVRRATRAAAQPRIQRRLLGLPIRLGRTPRSSGLRDADDRRNRDRHERTLRRRSGFSVARGVEDVRECDALCSTTCRAETRTHRRS
jgi:hypothetical protein